MELYKANTRNRLRAAVKTALLAAVAFFGTSLFSSCEDSESYSDLLRTEEKAVNRFLAHQKVALEIPSDSTSFITGPDAPFYKLDEEGYLYMQVISKGDASDRVEEGDVVYFRFERANLLYWAPDVNVPTEGNSDNLTNSYGNTSFVYKNLYLDSSTQWGTGIQVPLRFFGYNCEVNLVLQSYYGFLTDQTTCTPYLINLRYFKPEY